MNQYRRLILFASILFFIGLLFGLFLPLFLSYAQKEELADALDQFFQDHTIFEFIDSQNILWQSGLQYLILSIFIFLLGLSVIGTPIILLILFIKGTMVGFTSGFIIAQLKGKGVLFVLFSIIPQNLLIVPALIFFTASSIAFALFLIRNRLLKYNGRIKPYFASYLMVSLGLTSMLLVAAIYESYLAPIFMERSVTLIYG